MNRMTICLGAALLLAGAAHAAPDRPPPRATAQQRAELEGLYALDNGQRAHIFALDDRLYIELQHRRKELVPAGPGVFATRDGTVTVQAQPGADGRILVGYQPATPDNAAARYAAAGKRPGGGGD